MGALGALPLAANKGVGIAVVPKSFQAVQPTLLKAPAVHPTFVQAPAVVSSFNKVAPTFVSAVPKTLAVQHAPVFAPKALATQQVLVDQPLALNVQPTAQKIGVALPGTEPFANDFTGFDGTGAFTLLNQNPKGDFNNLLGKFP